MVNDTRTPILLKNETMQVFSDYIKKDKIKFYQFYNTEVESSEFSFMKYSNSFKDSTIPKKLNKSYYDIETFVNEAGDFTDPDDVEAEINAIAVYNNITNTVYGLAYVHKLCKIESKEQVIKRVHEIYQEKILENPVYVVKNIKIEVLLYDTEEELIINFFEIVRSFNTLTLIGFNSKIFDDPYSFNRTSKLFGNDKMKEIISEFGEVEKFGNSSFELPDYILVDLLQLYKPVGQGGNGLGKSLPNYKLNTVAFRELGVTKLELDGGFRYNYINRLPEYIAYNIFDTLLTFKIDEKLTFLELTYDLAKYNKSTMGAAMQGRSILYSYRNNNIYYSRDKLVRAKKFTSEVVYEPKIPANMF